MDSPQKLGLHLRILYQSEFYFFVIVAGSSVGFSLVTNARVGGRLYGEKWHGDVLTITKYETLLNMCEL